MINVHELQSILVNNGGKILDNISTKQLESYRNIKQSLHEVNVTKNEEIQLEIAQAHKFGRKRIAKKIRKEFFEVLEETKSESELNILQISRMLFSERPRKRFRPKHFSLVTRLLHIIHENYPIYNSNVASLFGYTPPRGDKMPLFRKLNDYVDFYNYMIEVYREILAKGELYDLLKVLEIKNRAYKDVLNQSKSLDLVMRSASQLQKKGLLILPQKVMFGSASVY